MAAQKKNLIFLTGFMGSGKSTIAPILANTLGFRSVDIDREIELQCGRTIREIFSDFGEDYFRELEHKLLLQFSEEENCVVSLGGGTISNEQNLHLIKSAGILVYLKARPEFIFHRLRHKSDRPLVQSREGLLLSDEELRQRIFQLLQSREPFYGQADITVLTDEHAVGLTVDEIVRCLRRFVPNEK